MKPQRVNKGEIDGKERVRIVYQIINAHFNSLNQPMVNCCEFRQEYIIIVGNET
jgi:hypothetical protein